MSDSAVYRLNVLRWCRYLVLALLCAVSPTNAAPPITIDTLSAQIDAAAEKQDFALAIDLGKKALAIEEAMLGRDHPEVAGTLNLIAGWMVTIDRHADAAPLFSRAVAILTTSRTPGDPLLLSASNGLAAAYEATGRLNDANLILVATLETVTQRYGYSHRVTAVAASNLGYNLARQGRYQEAQLLYDRALVVARSAMDDDDPALARIENNVASNMTARGLYLAAGPLYDSALKIRLAQSGDNDADTATSYNGLAFNLSAQGRHADAAPFYRKAMAIREQLAPDDVRAATSYNNVAHNLNVQGKAADAAPLYARALGIWQRVYGDNHPMTAIGYSNVAANLQTQGKLDKALPLFKRALKIRLAILAEGHPDVAGGYFKLANNLRLQGRLAQAEPNYVRAIAIRRASLGNLHPDLAIALADYAELLMLLGPSRSAQAIALAREAADIARKRREQRLGAQSVGDGDAAAIARAQGSDANRADPLAPVYGVLLRALWAGATPSIGIPPATIEAMKAEAFDAAQDIETSTAALTMAQTAARTAAGTGPLTQLVRSQQDLSAKARELDKRLLAALAQGNQPDTLRLRAAIVTTGEALSAADRSLRDQFPDYAQLVHPRALSVAQTKARLLNDEALLLIVPVGADVFSFGLSATGLDWHRVGGGATQASVRVRNLRCQIDAATCGPDTSDALLDAGSAAGSRYLADGYLAYDRKAAFALYHDLIAPVEAGFAGKTRLYTTVTGTLGGLPLGVLAVADPVANEDGADPAVLNRTPWLADRYALVSLPSVSVLRALRRREPEQGASQGTAQGAAEVGSVAFVGYGAPLLEGTNAQMATGARLFQSVDADGAALADPAVLRALSPLPGTARELSAMAARLLAPGKDVLLGAAATETAVRADRQLTRARIVAFATHGILPREVSGVEEPGLVFTPPATATATDDGLLAASEVARLSLVADWVLLSACNTASSDGTPGADSLSSLARSFLYAGASALLASHWRVSDEATAALTVEALAGRTAMRSRSQALQLAMRAIRTGTYTDGSAVTGWQDAWAHPSAWGAFTVISNADE